MLTDAFDMGNRIHLSVGLDEQGRTAGRCGIVAMEEEPLIEVDPHNPKLCSKCFMDLAMSYVEDEPMEDALARGYEPAPKDPVIPL